ncbi:uncharacterized protein LOC135128792 [Zophobas morio]|uniref:uncharacterized protein LOC135128792 n=1 Tax=Zophobas morio TaxID=2755281 RepID=UPI0030839968
MSDAELSFADALRLVPEYDGQPSHLYSFLNKCEFALNRVKPTVKSIFLEGVITKLIGRALDVVKYREINKWEELKFMLEESFGVKKTISFLQLQLNSCKQNKNEDVRAYSLRFEDIQYQLINASCLGKSDAESQAIRSYIKSLSLTVFLEGLQQPLKNIVKARQPKILEEAVQSTIEEERILKSDFSQRNSFNPNGDKFCNFCGKRGHIMRECRMKNQNQNFNHSNQARNFPSPNYANQNNRTNFSGYKPRVSGAEAPRSVFVICLTKIIAEQIMVKLLINDELNVEGFNEPIKFYLVKNSFPIPEDGILGKPFLEQFNLNVNIKQQIIFDNDHSGNKTINNDNSNTNNKSNDEFVLPPRCERLFKVYIKAPNGDYIMKKSKQEKSIFNAESLIKVKNNQSVVALLNPGESEVRLDEIEAEISPFNKFDCFPINRPPDSTNEINAVLDRHSKVMEKLRLDHLNSEESRQITDICTEYLDLFTFKDEPLSQTNTISHTIPIPQTQQPIKIRPYRLPEAQKNEINKQVQSMLDQGVIEPSTSPWNSPLLLVAKKPDSSREKKFRIVVDFRKLNEVTLGDAYPLPNITDILDQLGRSRYFTVLDLASGFHQIPMNSLDAEKTAFSTPFGHYQYKRMPMGLSGAPACFQRLMDRVLIGLQGIKCFVYLDDIVIYAENLKEHEIKLKEVFNRLKEHNLKLQPDKCEFLKREVCYLGHLVTDKGIRPDPEKVKSVKNFPVPTNTKQVKAFLGLAGYYRRFVQNFSSISKPINNLLKKNVPFDWTTSVQLAFEKLKSILSDDIVLQYPDFSKPFNLTTDASGTGIGAILSQQTKTGDQPIAYASRSLNKAELNYSTTDKELLAIVWSVQHFRPYLYGREFNILSDHKPLVWLFNVKDPGSRLMRWRLKLEEYKYKIIYKSGKTNQNADALSRMFAFTDSDNSILEQSQDAAIKSWNIAREKIIESKQKSKALYDRNIHIENIHVGDQAISFGYGNNLNEDYSYHNEPFAFQPGVYFEAREDALITNDNWQLIVYSNISHLVRDQHLSSNWHSLSAIACSEIKDNNSFSICQNYENIISPTILRLKEKIRNLLDTLGENNLSSSNRLKRGLANFVGQASKFLFGTLDEEDANYYNEQIRKFSEREETHYLPLNIDQINRCKNKKICKQEQPIFSAHVHETCEMRLFTYTAMVPRNCDTKCCRKKPRQVAPSEQIHLRNLTHHTADITSDDDDDDHPVSQSTPGSALGTSQELSPKYK